MFGKLRRFLSSWKPGGNSQGEVDERELQFRMAGFQRVELPSGRVVHVTAPLVPEGHSNHSLLYSWFILDCIYSDATDAYLFVDEQRKELRWFYHIPSSSEQDLAGKAVGDELRRKYSMRPSMVPEFFPDRTYASCLVLPFSEKGNIKAFLAYEFHVGSLDDVVETPRKINFEFEGTRAEIELSRLPGQEEVYQFKIYR